MQEGIPTRSVSHRLDVISDLVKDKEVLDLGVVDARVARGNAEERFDPVSYTHLRAHETS